MTLNVEFEFGPEEAPKRMVIYADGDIDFPDDDLTFDLAAQEFGYPETEVIKLYNKWKKDPIKVIYEDIGVWPVIKVWLMIESAEQVLQILENDFSKEEIQPLQQCLNQARVAALDAETFDVQTKKSKKLKKLMTLRKQVDLFLSEKVVAPANLKKKPMSLAHMHAVTATWSVAAFLTSGVVLIGESRIAAAYNASNRQGSSEWKAARHEQELWEINRFVELTHSITSRVMQGPADPEK